ncbi:MAG: enoyl-CoA hydratase/isomerase family protein [Myxococcales bacterium]|nr:enoyl-CoA hydratase/isomerase family protein [Myxococcales bacterium]
MPEFDHLIVTISDGVLTVVLNRPEVHNAFNAKVLRELTAVFTIADQRSDVRVVVLEGAGRSFCAGADLGWMSAMIHYTEDENVRDSEAMATMFRMLNDCPKPTIAKVGGAALGGGVGIVAAVDMTICSTEAVFALSEVRLGLVPAVISPYVLRRIGPGAARRYFLTGERFGAEVALRLGLVSEVVSSDQLDSATQVVISSVLRGGPVALTAAKQLIQNVPYLSSSEEDGYTTRVIAGLRVGQEGQEGMSAFLNKKPARWVVPTGGQKP